MRYRYGYSERRGLGVSIDRCRWQTNGEFENSERRQGWPGREKEGVLAPFLKCDDTDWLTGG